MSVTIRPDSGGTYGALQVGGIDVLKFGTGASGDPLEVAKKTDITTAFTGANVNLSANGYQKLPSGLIIQWGTSTTASAPVTFPVAFPNALVALVGTCLDSGIAGTAEIWTYAVPTKTGFFSAPQNQNGTAVNNQAYWIALGY